MRVPPQAIERSAASAPISTMAIRRLEKNIHHVADRLTVRIKTNSSVLRKNSDVASYCLRPQPT